MSSQVDLIAILTPKAGKMDRVRNDNTRTCKMTCPNADVLSFCQVIELIHGIAEYVQKNETGTLKYQMNREVNKKSGLEEIIMIERCELSPLKLNIQSLIRPIATRIRLH